tara:strand:- start:840 stop:1391 length:552 start_codon:yes stop_codon:yes gene_type:complete
MLTITPRADTYISNCGIPKIRFGVRTNKGCAGFEYIWEADEPTPNDYQINVNDKYTLLIDIKHKKYIDECSIDLKDVDDGTGYKICFDNEKVEVKCGCGESLDFPDDVSESPSELWEPKMTFRFFHEDNNPWLNPAEVDEEGNAKITFGNESIDHAIRGAGDSVTETKETDLSDKYKQWREIK